MTAQRDPLIAENLSCRRGHRLLFQQLNMHLAAGDRVWLRGANGAGKSSLLRILTGLLPAQEGTLRFGDTDIWADRATWAATFHYLGHLNAVKPGLTVAAQLGFFARALGCDSARIPGILEKVGLARQKRLPIRVLSQGQKRRLALARLLVAERPIWFLDEPMAGLDTDGTALVDTLLDEHCGSGGRALVISHSPLARATNTITLS